MSKTGEQGNAFGKPAPGPFVGKTPDIGTPASPYPSGTEHPWKQGKYDVPHQAPEQSKD